MSVYTVLRVESVKDGGAGHQVGLQKGDILQKYNDYKITSHASLVIASRKHNDPDKPVVLSVNRSGQDLTLNVQHGKLGVSFEEIFTSLDNEKVVESKDKSLIKILSVVAYAFLILGIISSGLAFIAYADSFEIVALLAGVALLIQSVTVFSLLKVIAVMALEVKDIKYQVCK
ncbi:PDZ domain-containing protein [Nitrincola lacisaponensis]|uniref:PDZ domain-containing protein n=1 Tax=Nitrincola lacisaponensis TaxID=267850 RepID=UPI0005681123|nr:PDZ domain-containing protein [Nitrincola lacisaponensis]